LADRHERSAIASAVFDGGFKHEGIKIVLKIILTALENGFYDAKRGKSFEYFNFYLQLKELGHEVIFVPFDRIVEVGKKKFNAELLELVKKEKPDLFFASLFTDELQYETLDAIKEVVPSLGWLSDDHWRLENYSRFYAPHFTKIATTWSKAPEEYARHGIHNVIRSQWGCNTRLYHPVDVPKDIDVSFVGMKNKHRARIIHELKQAGIDVFVRGVGWGTPNLSLEEMLKVFSRSRINLNLNPPTSALSLKSVAQIFARRRRNMIMPDTHWSSNLRSFFRKKIPQIKARPFEVSACGGFCISGLADDMKTYYEPNKEMVFYNDVPDLAEKIRFYLAHPAEAEVVARAGYERTIKEHTFERRFNDIFKEMELP